MPTAECCKIVNKIDEFVILAAFTGLPQIKFEDEIINILQAHNIPELIIEKILVASWALVPHMRKLGSSSERCLASRMVLVPLVEEAFSETYKA
ncbi:hypothetical protein TWF694_011244 [Orbilia ellipsospora]|uniref:Uncharacterized protein n=1 Tax=Orbilia ellipsospora TaxID=2528407 RepID=A0AAV9XB35_9PEZI